jgi:hypothetical protein
MSLKARLRKLESEAHAKDNEFVVCFKDPDTNEMEIPLLDFKGTIEDGEKLLSVKKSYIVYTGVLED